MADSLSISGTTTATLSPVEFAGATLYVVDHEGKPFAPMKPIVEAIGLDWSAQHAKLKSNAARWGMGEIAIPSNGGTQLMTCIALHKLAGWMATISSNKVKDAGVRDRVVKYQNECDTALWDYWNTGHAVRPNALPATITPAQAQHLREFVQLVVESGKQGHGETWARLHRKMKVNSYLMLRPDQFNAAVTYLQGKFDDTSIAALIQKHLPKALPAPATTPVTPISNTLTVSHVQQAMRLANAAAAKVQQNLFDTIVSGNEPRQNQRWLVSATCYVDDVPFDAFIANWPQIVDSIGDRDGCMATNSELAQLASVCNQRLAERITHQIKQA